MILLCYNRSYMDIMLYLKFNSVKYLIKLAVSTESRLAIQGRAWGVTQCSCQANHQEVKLQAQSQDTVVAEQYHKACVQRLITYSHLVLIPEPLPGYQGFMSLAVPLISMASIQLLISCICDTCVYSLNEYPIIMMQEPIYSCKVWVCTWCIGLLVVLEALIKFTCLLSYRSLDQSGASGNG